MRVADRSLRPASCVLSPEANDGDREEARLKEAQDRTAHWKRWGPYLAERQWGTVREDYSPHSTAWDSFPHDHARSRAYRWGEDGIAGITDNHGRLCLALWNGHDPILKERLFGLTGREGNHGEDVKEYYYYLDSTPTHSYMKYLYKYPQAEFPCTAYTAFERTWAKRAGALFEENRQRDRRALEFELIDTGVFDGDRYFDVVVEYTKAGPDDVLVRITVTNRGPEASELHLLPTLWYRNTWSWDPSGPERPTLCAGEAGREAVIEGEHASLGARWLYCEGVPELLFTENDTNVERLYGRPNARPHVKDSINDYVVAGRKEAVNPERVGTKAAALERSRRSRARPRDPRADRLASGDSVMNCREAIDILADYLDASLTPAVLDRLETHLRNCEPCRAYVATYRRTAELAAKVNQVEMPPAVRQRLRDFLAGRRLGQIGKPTTPRDDGR